MQRNQTNSRLIIVKESKVHGKGVYAIKDIPKGTKIIEYVGRKITKKNLITSPIDSLRKGKGQERGWSISLN